MAVILIIVVIISTAICWRIAKRKNLNVQLWIILAAFIGPFAIPFALLAKPRNASA